jgi:hypothetical protein
MMKVCLLRQQKVKELTRKTYLHHQYKSVHQKPDSSTINQTDYWEDVKKKKNYTFKAYSKWEAFNRGNFSGVILRCAGRADGQGHRGHRTRGDCAG